MIDNATLVERLHIEAGAQITTQRCARLMAEAADRIAELEDERDKHKDNAERLYATLNDLRANARPALDRIAELEAANTYLTQATPREKATMLAEREACAKIAYEWLTFSSVGRDIAATIRARPAP